MLHGYIAHADHDQAVVDDFQRWFHLHGALVIQQMAESGLFGKKLSLVGSCWIATHGDVLTRALRAEICEANQTLLVGRFPTFVRWERRKRMDSKGQSISHMEAPISGRAWTPLRAWILAESLPDSSLLLLVLRRFNASALNELEPITKT